MKFCRNFKKLQQDIVKVCDSRKNISTDSWSSIQLQESAPQQKKKQSRRTPRILRNFAQSRIVAQDDIHINAGTANSKKVFPSFSTGVASDEKPSQECDMESQAFDSAESNKNSS